MEYFCCTIYTKDIVVVMSADIGHCVHEEDMILKIPCKQCRGAARLKVHMRARKYICTSLCTTQGPVYAHLFTPESTKRWRTLQHTCAKNCSPLRLPGSCSKRQRQALKPAPTGKLKMGNPQQPRGREKPQLRIFS